MKLTPCFNSHCQLSACHVTTRSHTRGTGTNSCAPDTHSRMLALTTGRSCFRLLSVRQQPRRVASSAPPRSMVADASARAPELPDAICVHCGQRFNSAYLAYGFDTRKLCAEARGTIRSHRTWLV